MTKKKPEAEVVHAPPPGTGSGRLKALGGSVSDAFNNLVVNQALQALWLAKPDTEARDRQYQAAVAALAGIRPSDEIEGMVAAQMVATHSAAMECYRRAMIPDQTFEGRQENLNQANKLTRSYTLLMDTLNRHRGKGGQQRVTVEHVHVHQGGQAIVGTIQGVGGQSEPRNELMHSSLPMHQSLRCGARTRRGTPCCAPAVTGKTRCRMHGGAEGSGGQPGNLNALKHGRYSAESITLRRHIRDLLRSAHELVEKI